MSKATLTVVGAAGRMGRRIVALATESGRFQVVAALETAGHPEIGRDIGPLAGLAPLAVTLGTAWPTVADVAIDFSLPEAAGNTIEQCARRGIPLVMGTTGLGPDHRKAIEAAAEKVPVIYGTNMSVGMNVLFAVVGKVAAMLGPDYDVEIVEQHHRFKKDAPSGSALTLAHNVCTRTGRDPETALVHGRDGKDALRQTVTIGMHAVRAGDITGVHSVLFSTLGETVTLNHTAHSRETFVRGALRAAEWLIGQKPGLYTMADVLGID